MTRKTTGPVNRTRCNSGPDGIYGPDVINGPMYIVGPVTSVWPDDVTAPVTESCSRNSHRNRNTETETLLRVIEISKHKINIINEEKYLWARHRPKTVTETETLLRVIEISKHKINIINEEKNL